jgi:hypothetical protein
MFLIVQGDPNDTPFTKKKPHPLSPSAITHFSYLILY